MSASVFNHVLENSQAEGKTLLVLIAIASRADDDGVAWPGIEWIAKRARCSLRKAQDAIRELQAMGELQVEYTVGRSNTNRYTVLCTPTASYYIDENGADSDTQTAPFIEGNGAESDIKGAVSEPEFPEKVQSAAINGAESWRETAPYTSGYVSDTSSDTPKYTSSPAVAAFLDSIKHLRGFKATSRLAKSIEKYTHLDLELQALKMESWLEDHPKRKCNTLFILNWLARAETPLPERSNNGQHRQNPRAVTPLRQSGETEFKLANEWAAKRKAQNHGRDFIDTS